MCSPTLAFMGLGAVLSAGQIRAQQKQAERDGAQQAANVIQSSNFKQADLNAQAVQANRQSSQQATAGEIEAARVASSARVQSGEAGITGTGVNRLLGDIGRQASEKLAITGSNLRGTVSGINAQKTMTDLNTSNSIKSINKSMEAPSVLSQALTIGSGALSGYTMGSSTFGNASFAEAGSSLKGLFTGGADAVLPGAQRTRELKSATGYSPGFYDFKKEKYSLDTQLK